MTMITYLIASLDTPQALNERRLAKELKIVARGRSDGARNHPPSDATELTEIETSVVTFIQQAIDQFSQWLKRRLKEIAKAVAELAPSEQDRDYDSPVDEARFAIAKLRDERRDELTAAYAGLGTRTRQLRHFQREHGLTHRSASYHPVIFSVGAALLVLLAESVANFQLFADASDLGMLGGASYAVSFAFANLLIGYVVIGAIGLRYAGHVSTGKRIAGLAAVLLGVVIACGYNAYVAVYRGMLEANPDGGGFGRIRDLMLADPTGFLNNDHGLLLFIIGIGSVLAFALEGYLLYSDCYPGYAPMDRAQKEAEEAYEDAKRAFRDAAEKIVDAKIAVIDNRLAEAERKTRGAIDQLNQADVDAQTAEQAAVESRHVAQRLIATYRAENAAVRDTASPAYFRHLPDFGSGLHGLPAMNFGEQRKARLDDVAELRGSARAAKEELRRLALEALEQVKADAAHAEAEGARRAADDTDDAAPPALVTFPRHAAE